jgi:hypothetical protein
MPHKCSDRNCLQTVSSNHTHTTYTTTWSNLYQLATANLSRAYYTAKKPKLKSLSSTCNNCMPFMPHKCSDCDRLHVAGLSKDEKFLAVQKEPIEPKEGLNIKNATILETKHNHGRACEY